MVTLRKLSDQVIVITGATSGIGLATARMAARRGAKLVLAARNERVLDEIARELEREGATGVVVAADVGRKEDVERIAAAAIQKFGRIDTWVNNAGVGIWGKLEDGDEADARRLFDTNFWGTVNGSLVAARHMRETGGAIINLGSVSSDRAEPFQGVYAASKHAVKGFTDALRMELEQERAPISVTLVKPAAIGTPFHQHVKNDTDRETRLPSPLYAPEEVARTILHAATRPERDLYVGSSAVMLSNLAKRAPRLMDYVGERYLGPAHLGETPARRRPDNLYQAGVDGQVRGHHRGQLIRPSLYTRWRLNRRRLRNVALVAAASVAAVSLLRAQLDP